MSKESNDKLNNTLYIVPTPIGNLDDITIRSIETLRNSDYILCEDTRTSKKLLIKYNIDVPLFSYHAFNEHKIVSKHVNALLRGKKISLISDAEHHPYLILAIF